VRDVVGVGSTPGFRDTSGYHQVAGLVNHIPLYIFGEVVTMSEGLTITQQSAVDSVSETTLTDVPPTTVVNELLSSFEFFEVLVEASREILAGQTWTDAVEELQERGLEHDLVWAFARIARGNRHAVVDLFDALEAVGRDRGIDDLRPVIGLLQDVTVTPTVQVEIQDDWWNRRRDQREAICELLALLAQGSDVRIVGSPIEQRRLATEHRANLPGVSDHCNRGPSRPPTAVAEDAAAVLDGDGRPIKMLRSLTDEPTQTLSYNALYAEASVSEGRVRQTIGELEGMGLVATFQTSSGKAVELLGGGEKLVEIVDAEIGRQSRLDECVSASPNPSHNSRVQRRARDPPDDGGGDRRSQRCDGFHTTAYLDRWEQQAATTAPPDGGIGLIDAPVDQLEDAGTRLWGFDADQQTLLVGAEYINPMQYWVATALALADFRTFDRVLDEDRLQELFEDVPEQILRDARNIGGLTDEVLDSSTSDDKTLKERIDEWREELLEMTRLWRHGDYDSDAQQFRGDITASALGLAGTIVHLLDAAGVGVRRILRLPDLRRHFDKGDHADRRQALLKTIAIGTAIQSQFENRTAYRLLFEHRDDHRERALDVNLRETNPQDRVGQLIGSWMIVGPNVSDLQDELTDQLRNPAELHEDAPEIAIATHVTSEFGRDTYSETIRQVLRKKNMDPTREAVSFLQALTGSPYDAARAIGKGLRKESKWRTIRLDEVRVALSQLDHRDLLPESDYPALQKILQALLRTARSVTKSELAELADVSSDSVTEHIDSLVATGLVREEGGQYRFELPFAIDEERGAEIVPWYVTADGHRGSLQAILDDIATELVDDPSRFGDADDVAYRAGLGDLDAVLKEWPWIEEVLDAALVLAADVEEDPPETTTVTFGRETPQMTITGSTRGGVGA
jgi:DNA-binding transcriptional ArsR family regulator